MGRRAKKNRGCAAPALLLLRSLVLLLLLIGAIAAVVAWDYQRWTERPLLESGERADVVIPHGTPWKGVVALLDQANVVERPRYFDVWGRIARLPHEARAGEYSFEGPVMLEDVAMHLRRGSAVEEVSVTIPEGFNIWGVGERLEEAGVVSGDAFVVAATDTTALADAGIDGSSFEGFLFPDTYRFATGTSASDVVTRLHDRWVEVWQELGAPDEVHGLNRAELVTLASIVEKETGVASERPRIARVFYNRLERGMKLQTDPTCVYSRERWAETPTPSDCKNPSNRYSTYIIAGLPPGPIANPGRDALRAVLEPAEGAAEDELYFVAKRDGTGAHHFSTTLEEHNRAIRRYLR